MRLLLVLFVLTIGAPLLASAESASAHPGSAPSATVPSADEVRARIDTLRLADGEMLVVGDVTLAKAVTQFYEQQQFNLIWNLDRVQQLLNALSALVQDGLDPEDYHYAELLRAGVALESMPAAQRIDFDLLATDAYLRALIHLFRGKVDPRRVDPRWNFAISDIASSRALQVISAAVSENRVEDAFAKARPRHIIYAQMQHTLAELRAIAARGDWPQLDDGPTLKPGMVDARVPILRARLIAAGIAIAPDAGELYDPATVAAVKQFQREQSQVSDGAVGKGTRAALNISINQRIDEQRADLERARWLLHDVQGNFVLVNVAGYRVDFYRGNTSVWNARVQVGTPARDTPIFKSKVSHITVNPSWVVPPTILRKDIVPKLRKNPNYLAENRIRIFDSRNQPLSPSQVDWDRPGNIALRQEPGPKGALGRAAIRFPNPYAIYLHDTPHQELFSSPQRTFSSGCIRVERALELVELLFDDSATWNRAAIDAEIAKGKTRNVNLARPVPMLLTYWTVHRHADGRISFNPDVYKRNPALIQALNTPRR